MGSNAEAAPDEITVLVTGFGPFRINNPINPSWEIAKSLPPFLPPPSPSPSPSPSSAHTPRVRLLVHPSPIRVSYRAVRELVPTLWEAGATDRAPRIDLAVHVGMASGREFYSVERRGHRDGYGMRDVDQELLRDGELRRGGGGQEGGGDAKEGWIWEGLPEELLTDVNVDDVLPRWRAAMPSTDLRISEDAGRYLCDFIYYSSLAYLEQAGQPKRVLFLHVPVDPDPVAIARGTEVLVELIRAAVAGGVEGKEREEGV